MAYIGQKPINVPNGGTGQTSFTANSVLTGNAAGAIANSGAGTSANLLRGNAAGSPTFSTACAGSFSFSTSTVGGNVVLLCSNSNNTNPASNSVISSSVGGSSSGDPVSQLIVTGSTTWTFGVDNSAGDQFVFAPATSLGTAADSMIISNAGLINYPLQSCFLAYLATTVTNATGNGATYTLGSGTALTEIFDQHNDFNTNGTYTCPVTSRVDLRAQITVSATTIATNFTVNIITSNRTYQTVFGRTPLAANQSNYFSVIADMDAADTATITCVVTGEAGNTDSILGGATLSTYFCGAIVA